MTPIFRVSNCIFAYRTVCMTTFVMADKVWMNGLVTEIALFQIKIAFSTVPLVSIG
jgi:hypothetical protein